MATDRESNKKGVQKLSAEAEKSQHARFVETAGELGCDESEEASDEKLKAIARAKPKNAHKPADPVGWYVRDTTGKNR